MEKEKIFLIKQSEIQRVINYLVKQSYIEVHQLLPLFFNLKEGVEKHEQDNLNEQN